MLVAKKSVTKVGFGLDCTKTKQEVMLYDRTQSGTSLRNFYFGSCCLIVCLREYQAVAPDGPTPKFLIFSGLALYGVPFCGQYSVFAQCAIFMLFWPITFLVSKLTEKSND